MANESVLINIKIEGTENEAKINAFSASIIKLQEENKKLAETNKQLAKAEGDNSAEIAKNTSQIELNKQKISEGTASRKGLIQTIQAEDNSIKALSVRNAELIRERNLINTSTEAGRKKIAEINAQLDANNAKIRENSSALEKQKINIGNYASALDGVVPGLGGFVSGIQGMTRASLAFIATPIGAVIGALGLALGALMSYFKGSEEGQDRLNKITSVGSAIFAKLGDVVQSVGKFIFEAFENPKKAISDFADLIKENISNRFEGLVELIPAVGTAIGLLFEGKFSQAGQVAIDAVAKVSLGVDNLTEKTKDAINAVSELAEKGISEGQKVAELQKQIRALDRQYQLDSANTALKVAKLREDAIKQEGDQKRKTIEEAIALERKLNDQYVNLVSKRLDLAKLEDAIANNTIEDNDALIKAEVDLINAKSERYQATLRFEKQLEAINDREQERIKKEVELLLKNSKSQIDSNLTIQSQYQESSLQLNTSFNESIASVNESFRKRDVENNKKRNDLILAQEEAKQKGLELLQNQALQVGFQLAGKNKLLQSALTLTSTYFSAQKAFESQFVPVAEATSPIRGAIAAALAVVQGLSRVAAINGVSFAAGGGDFLTKGPTLLMVGDNPGGVERVSVTPISGKGQTVVGDGLIKMAGGGSVTTGIINNEIRQATQSTVQTVLVLQDFELAQYAKNQTIAQARVI